MLVVLGDLESTQAKSIEKTYKYLVWILNYAASYPMDIIRYNSSDMRLLIHSYASCLSVSRARSQAGGHHYLSENTDNPSNKRAINTIYKIMGNVMGSAAEA